MTSHKLLYSVIIPLKNEEENVHELVNELEPVMQSLKEPWELICIDDGSTDNTPRILTKLALEKPFLRIITFKRNFGQSECFRCRIQSCKWKVCYYIGWRPSE